MKIIDHIILNPGEKKTFRVKVVPRQPKTEFFDVMADGTLKIRLKAIPKKGRANKELVRFLSDELGILGSSIEIVSGAADSVKMVRIS